MVSQGYLINKQTNQNYWFWVCYINRGGVSAAAKIAKYYSLSIGTKFGATVGFISKDVKVYLLIILLVLLIMKNFSERIIKI